MNRDLQELPIEKVVCRPQVRERFDEEAIRGLAASMRSEGLLQPILVVAGAGHWTVVDGERRLRAARQLEWRTIPAFVDAVGWDEAKTIHRQLISNCQRENLTPIELAFALDRLRLVTGWTGAELAEWLGLSAGQVSKSLTLLVLPEEIRQLIHEGRIPASTAYHIAREPDPKRQGEMAREAASGRLSREDAARATRTGSRTTRAKRPGRSQRHQRFVHVPLGPQASLRLAGKTVRLRELMAAVGTLSLRLGSLAGEELSTREVVSTLRTVEGGTP